MLSHDICLVQVFGIRINVVDCIILSHIIYQKRENRTKNIYTHTNTKSSKIFFELISETNVACALSLQVLQAFLISSPFFPSLDSPQWERFPSHLNQIFEDAHGRFYVSDNFAFNRSSLDTFIYLIVIRL